MGSGRFLDDAVDEMTRLQLFPHQILLELSGLSPQGFVNKYWEMAYGYLMKRAEGDPKFKAELGEIEKPDTYGNRLCCIGVAAYYGFMPSELGRKLRGR